MTYDSDLIVREEGDTAEPQSMQIVAGRMVSLRFIRMALRRRRRLWIGLAIVGLLAGVGYHVAVPLQYRATSTLYLALPSGTNETVGSANDLALLQTTGVAQRAIATLGEPDLTAAKLFGKTPGIAVSDNVMTITVAASTSEEAVRRVNAVASAYLAFRAAQYNAQNQSVVTAANNQIKKLQAQIASLTTQINAAGPTQSGQVASLVTARAAATSQITSLQQSIQQDNLNTLSISQGSRVITTGTAVKASKNKALVVDGLTGLVAGLAIGLAIVVVQAVLSDRLRRREDIAAVLGSPVDISIGRVKRKGFLFRRSIRSMASAPVPEVQQLAQYLEDRLRAGGPRPTELVVAIDDVVVPAAALAVLAASLSTAGRRVLLVDATDSHALAKALKVPPGGSKDVRIGNSPTVALVAPPRPWEPDEDNRWEDHLGELASADAVLIVATVDPAVGAWHLRTWATDAIVTISAGHSTAQQINATGELLDAADVTVSSAVLLDADKDDESVGIPEPGASTFGRRRLDLVQTAVVTPT